ncbi:hypothetical protein [Ruegeria sp. A3M17]|uniref:hypothetical protein n=1 Tax=Ruegeria sp. A3M17 TaxID=2267229 RepID=UPI000DFB2FDF|nr:hypothetical protein [Ruegeria sp. A3M17]RBW54938.1 hypothetical protein DS906_15555 [Ruegeria sp. A3M17]
MHTLAYETPTPEQMKQAMAKAQGKLLIVDFDETLWLRNSTESFLAHARPAPLAAAILRGLDLTRPWRIIGGRRRARDYRDWIRVLAIATLMPWTLRRWARIAPKLGRTFSNTGLEQLMTASNPARTVIVSNGYTVIIAPLLEGYPEPRPQLVAASLMSGWKWRRAGKLANTEAVFDALLLDGATVVTDHEDDAELLARVGNGLLCVWPEARYERAFAKCDT